MKNWRFDMIFLCLKWFCFIEKLIERQNSRKAYKKQTLSLYHSEYKPKFLSDTFDQQSLDVWISKINKLIKILKCVAKF